MTLNKNPLPKISESFRGLPAPLIKHLRQVLDASSPSDAFSCYCNLLEWLATYLDHLANSVYVAGPPSAVVDKLEQTLRQTSTQLAFGTAIGGLRAFSTSSVNYERTLPELQEVFSSKKLPVSCARLTRAFDLIRKAREEFEIPPSRLDRYLKQNLPNDNNLGKCNLVAFLSAVVPFRNKGIGHQAEESWFPRNKRMYEVIRGFLDAAVDDLLTWPSLHKLLVNYEVVAVDPAQQWINAGKRVCAVTRKYVADGFAPLGTSHMTLNNALRAESGLAIVARRDNASNELTALVRFVKFPQTLQSSESIAHRYAELYLLAYLEHGLITPTQRQTKLQPRLQSWALPERERQRVESEAQAAINAYFDDASNSREDSVRRLEQLLGEHWGGNQERVKTLLEELPKRRKDYIFEQVDNNLLMSFTQLRAESELSEPDLDTVLGELEQEQRVRQISAGGQDDRAHSHFKAQDPTKPARLRAILEDLKGYKRPRRGFPAPLWRLVTLCADLLGEDGIAIPDQDLVEYRVLFAESKTAEEIESSFSGSAMTLLFEDERFEASDVRDLYSKVGEIITRSGVNPSPVLPLLIGKSRYLVSRTPKHANGTHFANECRVGDLYFEGNLTRAQAVAETVRFLNLLGLPVTSPEVDQPQQDLDIDEDADGESVESDVGSSSSRLEIEIYADSNDPEIIRGSSVRRFFSALLAYLLRRNTPLAEVVPVKTGRVRYLLSEEPYHRNGRRFDSMIEIGGYYMNTAYTYENAINAACTLCEKLDLRVAAHGRPSSTTSEDATPLSIMIEDETVNAQDVPSFLKEAVDVLFGKGLLTPGDIPYKSGRVRYLISETPTHDHGRKFIRPVEIESDDKRYYIETNVSRAGAVELIERLLTSKQIGGEPLAGSSG